MRAPRTFTTTAAVVALAFLALLGTGTRNVRTGIHIIKAGETLAELAAHYGTTPSALAKANGITNPNRIVVGSPLKIPNASAARSGSSATYRVRTGDTLGSIAARAHTSIAALVERNGLSNANLIRVGQVLNLPASSAAAPASGAQFHVVHAGETIAGLAARYGITPRQLIDANGLTDGRIYVGQRLSLLPAVAPPAPPKPTAASHRVTAGQTLSSIAQRYGTTVRAIQAANDLSDANLVVVGQLLTIPVAAGSTAALLCPVQGGAKFMNDWGFPRSGGRFHEGNDLFAARGTPLVAVVSGNAVQKTGNIGGLQVKLLGDDGTSYYYTHLDRFGTGGRVPAGTVIGYIGTSGNAAGGPPHVHFELHPGGGAAVNPYPSISPVC
jgi:LysM repeat protein